MFPIPLLLAKKRFNEGFLVNNFSLIKYSGTAQSALERMEKGTRQVVCVIYISRLGFFFSSILTVAKFIVPDWVDTVTLA